MAGSDNAALFGDVALLIIPGDDILDDQEQLMIKTAVGNGASYIPLQENGRIADLSELTHIISTHVDFPEYLKALDSGISVVKPAWLSDSMAKKRLATARQYSPDPSQYFHNVILSCGTLPESDEDAIVAGVLALGGQYSEPLTKIVTHIVSTDMNHEKCRIAREKSLKVKIVLPHWFDDCLRLGKMISERPYLLPDPEILDTTISQAARAAAAPDVSGASTARADNDTLRLPISPMKSPISPSKARKSINVFQGRALYLASDLALNEHLRDTLSHLIKTAGGTLVEDLQEAEIYISQYREHENFADAFTQEKTIGNLSWLYQVLNQNRWTNPTSKLLHYPVPKGGIPGFDQLRISISNYSGDARTYIQNLVTESGASFTKTMRQDNTHLITAHRASEKCDAAQEWNINIINHLWLEESYAKCAVQSLTNSRYTHFPSRTNLGEVCGQIGIDAACIEKFYVAPRLAERKKKQKELDRKNGVLAKSPSKTNRIGSLTVSNQNSDDEMVDEVELPSHPVQKTVKKSVGTPRGEKENRTPFTSSGRASKMKAIDTIHKSAPDIRLFEKEMKRKGGVTHGGRFHDNEETAKISKKRTSEGPDDASARDEHSDGEAQDKRPIKRAKSSSEPTSSLPPIKYRMMLTGDERWSKQPQRETKDRNKLRRMGILVTQEHKNVDILVAPRISRTKKFVACMANAPNVISSSTLDQILKDDQVDDLPMLKDAETEQEWGFRLEDALTRAKTNKHRLLRGWDIFVTEHLPGGFDTYKDIITVNGGNAFAFKGSRRGLTFRKRLINDPEAGDESQHQGGESEMDYVYLVSRDSAAEKALWSQFQSLAFEQGLKCRIVSPDWLLLAALSQQIRWDDKWQWST